MTNSRTWKTPCYNHIYTINIQTVINLEVKHEFNNQKFETNSLKLKSIFNVLLQQNILGDNSILTAPSTIQEHIQMFNKNKW